MLGPVRTPGLAAGNAHAEKVNALVGAVLAAAIRVLEVRVAGVDDQVAGFQKGELFGKHRIHHRGRGNQKHDHAGFLEHRDEVLHAVGDGDRFAGPLAEERWPLPRSRS